jgi:hypothetical protein
MRRIIEFLHRSLSDTEAAQKEQADAELKKAEDGFHLEEYKQLRTEVLSLLTRLDTVLQYAVVGSALVYSWMIVQGFGVLKQSPCPCLKLPSEIIKIGSWIPLALVGMLGSFAITTWLRIVNMGRYLKRLEDRLGNQTEKPPLGWQHREGKSGAVLLTITVWIALIGAVSYATCRVQYMVSTTTVSCPNVPKGDAKSTYGTEGFRGFIASPRLKQTLRLHG